MAYAYIGSMRTKAGCRDEVIALLLSGADGLRTAGCQVYAVCTDPADGDVIWVSEVWDSAEAHAASLRLPETKAAIGAAMPMLTGEFTRQELIAVGGLGVRGVTEPAPARSAWTAPAQLTQWARDALVQAAAPGPAARTRRGHRGGPVRRRRLGAGGRRGRLAARRARAGAAAQWLISPAMERWSVGPAPLITQIDVRAFEQPDGRPPQLRVRFDFDGGQRFADESRACRSRPRSSPCLSLPSPVTAPRPWLVHSGHVWTLDKFLGYQFTRRRERAGEYRERTGSLAPDAAIRPTGRYKILARFAEHDERFSSWAETEVVRAAPPSRAEAEQLIWPAIDAETARALGPGDWRPSLLYIDLIELVGEEHEPEAPTASAM